MAKYNKKRLFEALSEIGQQSFETPVANLPTASSTGDLAQLLNRVALGASDITDAQVSQAKIKKKQEAERDTSAFTKVLDFLSAPGTMVQNQILDTKELLSGEEGFGQFLKDTGSNVLATGAHLGQLPMQIATPGFDAPGEENVENFIQKNSVEHHGDGRIHGSRLISELTGWEPDSTSGRIGKGVAGFAVDVLTDPTTYLFGVGVGTNAAKAASKGGIKAADEIADVVEEAPEVVRSANAVPEEGSPFVKPPVAESTPAKVDLNRNQLLSTPRKTELPNLTPKNEWGLTPLDEKVLEANIVGLSPEAKKAATGARLTNARLYEKLRPIVYDPKPSR